MTSVCGHRGHTYIHVGVFCWSSQVPPNRKTRQRIASECNARQGNESHRNASQRIATHRNAAQRKATHRNASQRIASHRIVPLLKKRWNPGSAIWNMMKIHVGALFNTPGAPTWVLSKRMICWCLFDDSLENKTNNTILNYRKHKSGRSGGVPGLPNGFSI